MAFSYQTKTWTIDGVKQFESGFSLLNPVLKVGQITIRESNVFLHMLMNENNGVFEHNFNIQYVNDTDITDVDLLVSDAVSKAFPDAVEVV